ncbi:hypothetical protein ABZ707_20725 [Streptomyces sp. NPDC006923]|uniref:hypothetical protein n=1 Tax=Streptomyces sp. NPDC006923 TaxID=3155355 RepID=UPI0033F93A8D
MTALGAALVAGDVGWDTAPAHVSAGAYHTDGNPDVGWDTARTVNPTGGVDVGWDSATAGEEA